MMTMAEKGGPESAKANGRLKINKSGRSLLSTSIVSAISSSGLSDAKLVVRQLLVDDPQVHAINPNVIGGLPEREDNLVDRVLRVVLPESFKPLRASRNSNVALRWTT